MRRTGPSPDPSPGPSPDPSPDPSPLVLVLILLVNGHRLADIDQPSWPVASNQQVAALPPLLRSTSARKSRPRYYLPSPRWRTCRAPHVLEPGDRCCLLCR